MPIGTTADRARTATIGTEEAVTEAAGRAVSSAVKAVSTATGSSERATMSGTAGDEKDLGVCKNFVFDLR